MNYCRFTTAIIIALLCSSVVARDLPVTYDPNFKCENGLLGLRLPKSYEAVRSIGKLQQEQVVRVEDWGTYKSEGRELIFSGLTLHLVTFTNDKSRYMVESAVISGRQWALAGKIKIGDTVKDVLRRARKGVLKDGEIEIAGDTDFVRYRIFKGKVTKITYVCYTG